MTIKHANTLFALLILLLSYSLLLYPQVISDWFTYSFDDGTYSHAYLMPFIIGTLLWQQRNHFTLKFNKLCFTLMLCVAATLVISITAQQITVTRLLFPLYVILLFCSLFKPSSALIVPLALLWFIAPVWGALIGPLQNIAVVITTFFMQLTHIPIYVDGNFIQIPQGVFEVAEGCSGLRYFIVSVALSTLLCHLHLRKLKNIILLTLCAIIGAILVNGIRIVLIILIGYYTDMQSAIVKDHNMFGWFLYIPFIMALFYMVGRLEPHRTQETSSYTVQRGNNRAILTVLFSALLLSGLSIKLLMSQLPLFAYSSIQTLAVVNTDIPSASIVAYSSQIRKQLQFDELEIIDIRYDFEGRHDANRADYYLNNVIPSGWHKTASEMTPNSQLIWLSDRSGNEAIVQFWYEANGRRTGSLTVYKRNRILQAFKLNAHSALQWQFARCQTNNCRKESQLLRQLTYNITLNE